MRLDLLLHDGVHFIPRLVSERLPERPPKAIQILMKLIASHDFYPCISSSSPGLSGRFDEPFFHVESVAFADDMHDT